ncbi:metal ABC transporter substrate-binding protein [Thalassobacter stenotrophicus]|uniref:metal ABC transporter substrate-binding protein n=1 Tax=Thalassobacter stenotrophicus TaxID=266809 RepID=UPI002DDD8FA2|nr:metal ABC transporter substrate-binding protein [Thalassobacter stenotrophicus]
MFRLTSATLALGLMAAPVFADDKLKVVTTFTVIADMAANVAGDAAEVVSITKPGAEIHGYQPTPGDLRRAVDADLILWNGLNLELWFEQFLSNLGDIPSVTVSDGIEPIAIASGSYQGKTNPHAWIGADAAMVYVDNIAAAMADADPDNAAIYTANAAAYKAEIEGVLAPLRAQLSEVEQDKRWLVTCEGAFSYLARDFGLKELYLWPMNTDAVGTPQQVRAVIDGVRANDIPVVFCESTVNTAPAEQVARETGAKYGGVLFVDSLSEPDGPVPTYLDLLRVTSQTVVKGLTAE